MLILLDNFEQLLEHTASTVARLADLRQHALMVTSRETLSRRIVAGVAVTVVGVVTLLLV